MATRDADGREEEDLDEVWFRAGVDPPPFPVEEYGRVASVLKLSEGEAEASWDWLAELFRDELLATGPLLRILDIVRDRGCRSIVIEHYYVDADYRSEYSAHWSGRFADRGSLVMRWHFFQKPLAASDLFKLPTDPGYLGYAVLRPTELGLVGRSVIAPPKELMTARMTYVVDRPSLFGNPLRVIGVPFYQQDGEFMRCAHAATWICHYVAHNRGIVGRKLTAEIAAMPSTEGSKHRPYPSTGLTAEQMQAVFSRVGIPAFFLKTSDLPPLPAKFPSSRGWLSKTGAVRRSRRLREPDERIFRVVCKYLNSGFPVVVLCEGAEGHHAFTLVGWRPAGHRSVQLIACDDQVGPYELIDSPSDPNLGTHRGKWTALMIPIPSKVFLTGEEAESRARHMVRTDRDLDLVATEREDDDSEVEEPGEFAKLAPQLAELHGPVSVRARLIEGRRYKAVAARQDRDSEAVRVIRMARLPHWVWVVEFQDYKSRKAGQKDTVIAEIVFDSTSHDEAPIPNLIATASNVIDLEASSEESADDAEVPIWLAETDGRRWRSMISDRDLNDREYDDEALSPATALATRDEAPRNGPTVGLGR